MSSAILASPAVVIRNDLAFLVSTDESATLFYCTYTVDRSFDDDEHSANTGCPTISLWASGISAAAEANLERLQEIGNLPEDWNGYGAGRFTSRLIDKCGNIVSVLKQQPEIFPTGRNSIQLQYTKADSSYLEFEVFEDRTCCLLVPQRVYARAEEVEIVNREISRIDEIVKEFYGFECTEG